jgi:hypothetical protein
MIWLGIMFAVGSLAGYWIGHDVGVSIGTADGYLLAIAYMDYEKQKGEL